MASQLPKKKKESLVKNGIYNALNKHFFFFLRLVYATLAVIHYQLLFKLYCTSVHLET